MLQHFLLQRSLEHLFSNSVYDSKPSLSISLKYSQQLTKTEIYRKKLIKVQLKNNVPATLKLQRINKKSTA